MDKQSKLFVIFFCTVKLLLHLTADSHSGFQGDELLHIETGKHLAFGYMEFPPFIALLAFIQNLFQSNSVYIHRFFPHLASLLIIIYTAKTTVALGGKSTAVFLVLLAIVIAPGFGRSQQLFQPVVFSQLFWVLAFCQLTLFVKHLDKKSLSYLTVFCILGFLSKYDSIFFLFGLSSLLISKRTRTALIKHKFWINGIVFVLCILPNMIWQFNHDFPLFQMMDRLYKTQLDRLSRPEILLHLGLSINPVVSLTLVVPALLYFPTSKNRNVFGTLSIALGLAFLLLLYLNGKSYYFFPLILTLLPFGALFWEQYVISKRKWALYPISLFLLSGMILIPFGMPVYGFDQYLQKIYPYERNDIAGGQYGVQYDEYYSPEKWRTTMTTLRSVYNSIPIKEKEGCVIWGKNYAQAGAVNLLGKEYDLPKAFSYHGSFYSWAPKGKMPTTVIGLSYQVGDFFKSYFDEVTLVKSIYNPYADNKEELYQRIFICKKPKQDFDKMKSLFKNRIFE